MRFVIEAAPVTEGLGGIPDAEKMRGHFDGLLRGCTVEFDGQAVGRDGVLR